MAEIYACWLCKGSRNVGGIPCETVGGWQQDVAHLTDDAQELLKCGHFHAFFTFSAVLTVDEPQKRCKVRHCATIMCFSWFMMWVFVNESQLKASTLKKMEEFAETAEPAGNFKKLRELQDRSPVAIPVLAVVTKDISALTASKHSLDESVNRKKRPSSADNAPHVGGGIPTWAAGNVVNWDKCTAIAKVATRCLAPSFHEDRLPAPQQRLMNFFRNLRGHGESLYSFSWFRRW